MSRLKRLIVFRDGNRQLSERWKKVIHLIFIMLPLPSIGQLFKFFSNLALSYLGRKHLNLTS